MLRKLLVSTAIAGVLATGAYAQDAQTSDTAPAATGQDMQSDATGTDAAPGGDMSAQASGFLQRLSSSEYLASNITDVSVYGSDAQDAEEVATIENYLVGSDGQIAAVILTTSGDQSKTVAVPFDQISWAMQDGSPRATMAGGADLAAMPTFQMPGEQAAAASGEGNATAAGGTAGGTAAGTASGATAGSSDMAAGSGDMAAGNDSAAAGDAMASGSASDTPTMVGVDQFLSKNLISANVVSGPGDDAQNVGSINNLVVSSSGKVEAGVIGVGGFLGIGEKDVAVPFDDLTLNKQEDGTPRIVYAADQATLEQAPSFSDERPEQGGDQQSSASTDGQGMAATTGAAAGAAAGSAAQSADNAGDQMAQSADNAADSAAQSADNAADSASQAADNAAASADQAADSAGNQMSQANDGAMDNTSAGGAATGTAAGAAAGGAASASADGTASTGGAQEDMQPLSDTSSLTADNLLGTSVVGGNGDSVGDIGDIVLSPDGNIDQVIVDVGGFLGIGEKPVAISMDDLQFMRDSSGSLAIRTDMTSEQFEQAPEYQPEGDDAAPAASGANTGNQSN